MSWRVTPAQAMVAVSFSDSSNIALPCRSLRCWMKSCNAASWMNIEHVLCNMTLATVPFSVNINVQKVLMTSGTYIRLHMC